MSRPIVPEGAAALAETRSPDDAGGEWVVRLVMLARRGPGIGAHLTIAALLVIILGICLRTGIVPMRSYVEDLIFFADNAWRVLWGQRPHVDYSSGLGPVTYLISALGMKLAGGNLNGLGYGNALAGVAIGIWAYALLVRTGERLAGGGGSGHAVPAGAGPGATGREFPAVHHRHELQPAGIRAAGIVDYRVFSDAP